MSHMSENKRPASVLASLLWWVVAFTALMQVVRWLWSWLKTYYQVRTFSELSERMVEEYVPAYRRAEVNRALTEVKSQWGDVTKLFKEQAQRSKTFPRSAAVQPLRTSPSGKTSAASAPAITPTAVSKSKPTPVKAFELNERQERIYQIIRAERQANINAFAAKIPGVTARTLRRDLTKLEKLGLVEQTGRTKDSSYRLRS